MTVTKAAIKAQIIALASDPGSGWAPVPSPYGLTIRYTRAHETPEWQRGNGWSQWGQDTYDSHVFVTLVGGKVILGVSAAPWMGRRDSDCPLWLAAAVLADPTLALDTPRILALRRARQSARRTP